MACSYLAAPEASTVRASAVAQAVRGSIGPAARPILLVFALQRMVNRLASAPGVFVARRAVGSTARRTADATSHADSAKQSADARVA
jgi:hypothetical protein